MTNSSVTLGVLGDGQLARMLYDASREIGVKLRVYAYSKTASAAKAAGRDAVVASGDPAESLLGFLDEVDLVVFENEFIDCKTLSALTLESHVRFVPGLAQMMRLQDKLRQKKLWAELQLPTPAYSECPGAKDAQPWLGSVLTQFTSGAVLKRSFGGYDGYGNFSFSDRTQLDAAQKFCAAAFAKGSGVFAEERVAFRRELAMTACHSTTGEFTTYPLVVTEQESGACHWVKGPIQAIDPARGADLQERARAMLHAVAKKVPLHGAFTLEFFETQDGLLQINELAPRVHNSAHYTLGAAETSQFQNHLRAVLGLPLGSCATEPYFAMVNLLCPRDVPAEVLKKKTSAKPERPAAPLKLHWYEKEGYSAGRKMGHVTAAAPDADAMAAAIRKMSEYETHWKDGIRR